MGDFYSSIRMKKEILVMAPPAVLVSHTMILYTENCKIEQEG